MYFLYPILSITLFPFVEDESTEFSLNRFPFGDLFHFVPFVRGPEDVLNLFGAL
jgi:hypothetical protein